MTFSISKASKPFGKWVEFDSSSGISKEEGIYQSSSTSKEVRLVRKQQITDFLTNTPPRMSISEWLQIKVLGV